jgi:hypothetical protein
MSSIAVFLVLGGATAFAVSKVPNKSVGTKQLKANAVTAAKLKKNAVTTAKLKNEAVTGAKINEGTLGSVPSAVNATTTSVIKTSKGTISTGQQATVLQHGPISLYVKCEIPAAQPTYLSPVVYIASSTDGTTFGSWQDDAKSIAPSTPETDREVSGYNWVFSTGAFDAEPPVEASVSAQAANGESVNAFVGLAVEKDSNTCWYWMNATVIS